MPTLLGVEHNVPSATCSSSGKYNHLCVCGGAGSCYKSRGTRSGCYNWEQGCQRQKDKMLDSLVNWDKRWSAVEHIKNTVWMFTDKRTTYISLIPQPLSWAIVVSSVKRESSVLSLPPLCPQHSTQVWKYYILSTLECYEPKIYSVFLFSVFLFSAFLFSVYTQLLASDKINELSCYTRWITGLYSGF